LGEYRKAVQTNDCKEYGKLVRQLFLKLTVISHKLLFKHLLRYFAPSSLAFQGKKILFDGGVLGGI
jgi:hypothetical protein